MSTSSEVPSPGVTEKSLNPGVTEKILRRLGMVRTEPQNCSYFDFNKQTNSHQKKGQNNFFKRKEASILALAACHTER